MSAETSKIEWWVSDNLVPYPDAMETMTARVVAILEGNAPELIWFLEHPPLYTAGTSSKPEDLLAPNQFPVYDAGRGGQYTYHGPGQRVAYVMLDLRKRGRDVRAFVQQLEQVVIDTLAAFNVVGERREGRVGVWVDRSDEFGRFQEDKIAALGIRLRRWVSFHGLSLNVEPDLGHFGGITPCGIAEPGLGVTSLVDLGRPVSMADADIALRAAFDGRFGALVSAPPKPLVAAETPAVAQPDYQSFRI